MIFISRMIDVRTKSDNCSKDASTPNKMCVAKPLPGSGFVKPPKMIFPQSKSLENDITSINKTSWGFCEISKIWNPQRGFVNPTRRGFMKSTKAKPAGEIHEPQETIKQYKGPQTAVPIVSLTVVPSCPCFYR